MTQTNPMPNLYRRLSQDIGVGRKYVKEQILPDWWDDEIGLNSNGYAEGCIYISRRLALDMASIFGTDKIQFQQFGPVRFKHHAGVKQSDLLLAQALALRGGALTVACVSLPVHVVPDNARFIRDGLLTQHPAGITFEVLLDYCWQLGIAVVPVLSFPKGARKMDGLAAIVEGRPVIVLSRAQRQPAWQLFTLAHELAHIALGHVNAQTAIVDTEIKQDSADALENEANRFARELLMGNPVIGYGGPAFNLTADELARQARAVGEQDRVDPGVVALNYAWNKQFFPVAVAALNLLYPQADALAVLRARLLAHADLSLISDDNSAHLMRLMTPA